jgi:hypothetical protein
VPVIVEEASNGALPQLHSTATTIRHSLTLCVHLNGKEYELLRRRYPGDLPGAVQAAILELLWPYPPDASPEVQAVIDMEQGAV